MGVRDSLLGKSQKKFTGDAIKAYWSKAVGSIRSLHFVDVCYKSHASNSGFGAADHRGPKNGMNKVATAPRCLNAKTKLVMPLGQFLAWTHRNLA